MNFAFADGRLDTPSTTAGALDGYHAVRDMIDGLSVLDYGKKGRAFKHNTYLRLAKVNDALEALGAVLVLEGATPTPAQQKLWDKADAILDRFASYYTPHGEKYGVKPNREATIKRAKKLAKVVDKLQYEYAHLIMANDAVRKRFYKAEPAIAKLLTAAPANSLAA